MNEQQVPTTTMEYDITEEDQARLDNNFRYHSPQPDQETRYRRIRAEGREFARTVLRNVPPSRERSLALTKIEEAVMWANAAIARNEKEND